MLLYCEPSNRRIVLRRLLPLALVEDACRSHHSATVSPCRNSYAIPRLVFGLPSPTTSRRMTFIRVVCADDDYHLHLQALAHTSSYPSYRHSSASFLFPLSSLSMSPAAQRSRLIAPQSPEIHGPLRRALHSTHPDEHTGKHRSFILLGVIHGNSSCTVSWIASPDSSSPLTSASTTQTGLSPCLIFSEL